MIRNNSPLADNWTLRFEEASNNSYKIELSDSFGRKVETTDQDLRRAIETSLMYAFDMEKQLGNVLNKFTYDTFKFFLSDQELLTSSYSDEVFGSWIIEKKKHRIVLDGRDSLISFQAKAETNIWTDEFSTNLKELTFGQIKNLTDKIKNTE